MFGDKKQRFVPPHDGPTALSELFVLERAPDPDAPEAEWQAQAKRAEASLTTLQLAPDLATVEGTASRLADGANVPAGIRALARAVVRRLRAVR